MKIKNLPLNEIFLEDERFRISYYFSLEKMILSLKKTGLVCPPLVTLRDKHFILVSGWKRVLASLELSISPITVFVIEEGNELKTFLMAFYENLAIREFTLLEKAEVLSKLKKFGESEENIVRHYLPLLNIPPTLFHLDTFLTFSQFEPGVKEVIHKKNMPFSSVQLLSEFKPSERKLLVPLLLPLGQNKQKEFLEDLQEISRKDDIPVKKVFDSKEIMDILASDKLSPVQKAEKIRLLLRRKRFPHLFSWKDSFDSALKKMNCPREIAVKPSPFFEDEKISISFAVKNEEELRGLLQKLQELASREEFSTVFK